MTTTWETLHHYLTRAEAHVAIGERFIAQHKTLMRELERGGRDIVRAWRLLETLEQLQALHVADRDRLVKQLDDASSGAKLAAVPTNHEAGCTSTLMALASSSSPSKRAKPRKPT
jgi:hypothetical protein